MTSNSRGSLEELGFRSFLEAAGAATGNPLLFPGFSGGLEKQPASVRRAWQRAVRAVLVEFVSRVNAKAEAEMQRTGTITGAHHRAIESILAEFRDPDDAEDEKESRIFVP